MDRLASSVISFENFHLDHATGSLVRTDGSGVAEPVVLGSRALAVLALLVERQGQVVSKDEIFAAVWPGIVVGESNLTVQISALRRVLDQGRSQGSCIQTIHGRGYRFIPAVTRAEADNFGDGAGAYRVREHSAGPAQKPLLVSSEPLRLPDKASVAVLPFTSRSGDPDQEYFADGMVEKIILGWLRGLGLERYEQAFRENGIDLQVLAMLTPDDLKELGVTEIGHRRRLIDAIAALTAESAGAAADRAPTPSDRQAAAEAERRQLTVMFCDLAGSTALSEQTDPEDLAALIGAYHSAVVPQVERYSGYIAKYMGGGVLSYFGWPQAHEDDPALAIEAGLAVIDAVARLPAHFGSKPRVRVGIATGLVVVEELIGQGTAQEHNVVGEPPNLAAKLQSVADPGTLVISEMTSRLAGRLFDYRDLGAVMLQGFGEPVRAWQVVGRSGVESRFEARQTHGLTPLVGREEELEFLRRRWRQATVSDGRVALICGEPGIGKSRLTAALSKRIETEPHTRLRYFCSPHDQDSALYPFIGQLERAAGFARDDSQATKLDKLEALLGDAAEPGDISLIAEMLSLAGGERFPPLDLSPQRKKERTLAALLRQLQALARRQPVLMIFEDLQWIDPTSREVLDLTVEKITGLPVLLVATYRPEFQPPWVGGSQVTVVALNRLDHNEGAMLVHRLAGNLGALPADIVNEIVERTDGVPLFVEELTKAVVEAGADRGNVPISAVSRSSFAVPATLHASLLGRLDRLGPSAKNVAQVGAAIGRDFSHELLAAAARLAEPDLKEALRRLVEAGLIFQRGVPPAAEYMFKHALVQDTAYSTLLRGPRQALHRRIAEALEQRFSDLVATRPEIVAHHYGDAGMADKAITYWHLAGKLSVAKSAVHEAIAQLRRGLSLLDRLPETRERQRLELDLRVALTTALMAGKGNADPEVVATLERANQLVAETASVGTPLHFFVVYGLWVSTLNTGTIAAALEHATNFLSSAQSQSSSGPHLIGHRALAVSLMFAGDHRAALAHFETAASLYRPDEHRGSTFDYGQDIGVSAFVMLSWALWHHGYPDQSARAVDRALAYGRELGHAHTLAHTLYFAAMAAAFARDVATVYAYSNDCVAIASEHGFPLWAALGRILQGWADAQKGEATTGIARIRDGLAAVEATGSRTNTPLFVILLAEALALAGKIEEALSALDDALADAAVSGERGWDAEIHRLRGDFTARLPYPDPAKAEESFRTALAIAREQGTGGYELRSATSLARLWDEQGRRGEARELLAPVYAWFTEGFDTPDLKQAKRLLDNLT